MAVIGTGFTLTHGLQALHIITHKIGLAEMVITHFIGLMSIFKDFQSFLHKVLIEKICSQLRAVLQKIMVSDSDCQIPKSIGFFIVF